MIVGRPGGIYIGARRNKVNNTQVPPIVTGLHFVNAVSPGTVSPFGADSNRRVGVYYLSTRSRRVLPGLKWAYFLAGMKMVAPVAGLRP